MLPVSVAPPESSCQPCKARLPSQPASVLSIVSIDCCPTANCNPLFEPSFLDLIFNVAASVLGDGMISVFDEMCQSVVQRVKSPSSLNTDLVI
ncbi:hypothetical protein KCU81_g653, partial [Aureobasidium melanogenum]